LPLVLNKHVWRRKSETGLTATSLARGCALEIVMKGPVRKP
jgi:hypothetical protein